MDEFAQRPPDGDEAAAVALGQITLRRQPVAGLPLGGVEPRLQVEIDLVVEWDRAELETKTGHRAVGTSGGGSAGPGLVRAAIADNVISIGVKPPRGGRPFWASRSRSSVAAARTRRSSSRASARRAARLPIDELVLLDIDPERLAVVGGLAGRMLDRLGWGGRLVLTGDRDAAIDGADFVLIQLRVGGQAARLIDETLPPGFGLIGQETTGAGGFAKALRTVPARPRPRRGGRAAGGAGRLDRGLHQPGRDRHPGAERRGLSGDRVVQRRDQHPAPHGRALRGHARIASPSSTSGSTT